MSKSSGTIVINGKTYDTATGTPVAPKSSGRHVDGFGPVKTKKPLASSRPAHTGGHSSKTIHKAPAKTETLKRNYVKRPDLKAKHQAVARPNKHHPSAQHVNQSRLTRALETPHSTVISRFNDLGSDHPTVITSPASGTETAPPIEAMMRPAPDVNHQAKSLIARKEHLLAEGLEKATGYADKKSHRKSRRHGVTVGTSLASILLVAGIITYLNIPNIAVKVAASRAGITAAMPNYTAGFHRSGPISYAPGQITLTFTTPVDDRSYAITQKKSLWDSQSLLSNYVTTKTSDYEIFRDRGLTLYIYDNSNATWVDGGVWYTIEGQSGLTSDQLLKIAASM